VFAFLISYGNSVCDPTYPVKAKNPPIMRIEVEMHSCGALDVPGRLRLDGREIKVSNYLDQWHGADYRYFKLKGDDGNLYILRLDETRLEWELIMFQSP
jgi:hypothetical protein